jgi:hypothetical protein
VTDSTGWYARHLGGKLPPPQPQAYQPPPQNYPPAQPQGYPQHQNYEGYTQQTPYPSPQQPQINNIHDVVSAMGQWQGGEAARTETQRCPQCGGNHFFSRAQGARRGPPPAPSCFDCGYTGLFEQGDPTTWSSVA